MDSTNNTFNLIDFNDFDRKVFFDNVNKGKLTPIAGEFLDGNEIDIFSNLDGDSILSAQQKKESLRTLGKDYEKIYITYIPSASLEYSRKTNSISSNKERAFIGHPLIKVAEEHLNKEENSNLPVYDCCLSGRRSAICFPSKNSNALRLKGCGNLNIGFNLDVVSDIGPDHFEIRGSQFKNTCLGEQYITNIVASRLAQENLISGNIPVGFWKYGDFTESGKGLGLLNEAPLMDKYCGLFYTNGDKRLGEHFFGGVNPLLNHFLNNNDYLKCLGRTLFNFENIAANLPAKNFSTEKGGEITYNFFCQENTLFDKSSLSIEEYRKENLMFDYSAFLENTKNNTDSCDLLKIEANLLKSLVEHCNKINQEAKKSAITEEEVKELVSTLLKDLEQGKESIFELLVFTLSKIVHEMGRFKQILASLDVNWGTYDYHSNAHLDNFLVLNHNSRKLFTAPLDFDLAFTRKQFISLNYKNTSFDELITSERNILNVQLTGINMIPNINVNVLAIEATNDENKLFFENLKTVLIENMQNYYLKGYFNLRDNYYEKLEARYERGVLLLKTILVIESLINSKK